MWVVAPKEEEEEEEEEDIVVYAVFILSCYLKYVKDIIIYCDRFLEMWFHC
jgi:hypothetical protein